MFIIHMIVHRLASETRAFWESEVEDFEEDLPTWQDMKTYLQGRCRIMEKLEISNKRTIYNQEPKEKTFHKSTLSTKTFVTSTSHNAHFVVKIITFIIVNNF